MWFYDVRGRRLEAGRQAHAAAADEKFGPIPARALDGDEHAKNDLPDMLPAGSSGTPRARAPATAQSFCVPKADIAAAGYDLSLNRYKEVVHEAAEHRPPKEIIAELRTGSGDSDGTGGT